MPSHCDACVQIGTNASHQPAKIVEEQHQPNVYAEDGCNEIPSTETQTRTPAKTPKNVGRPRGTPPRKSHTFMTPPKQRLFRKRKATPDEWKKNTRKKLRMSGKEYVSQRGKIVLGKMVKSVNCSSCKFKCSENISEEKRQKLIELFWSLNTYERKKDFLFSRIDEKQTRRYIEPDKETGQKRKRDIHRSYFFDIDGTKTVVCKKFFKQTLDVGDAYIDNAMKNQSGGVFTGEDKRGKH